jgi:VIT1/CCC1 family predicted Fe2+/Mn2+ transporter
MTTIFLSALLGYSVGRLTKLSQPIAIVIACLAALMGMAVAGSLGQLAPTKAPCAIIEQQSITLVGR